MVSFLEKVFDYIMEHNLLELPFIVVFSVAIYFENIITPVNPYLYLLTMISKRRLEKVSAQKKSLKGTIYSSRRMRHISRKFLKKQV
ncbi:MAG TPA: hypothetical protein ENG15_00375 [Thermotoga sp.]|nr:hypothetical protein [Thermotoga sp.]